LFSLEKVMKVGDTVTRSGTNALHGEAFYYNRNSAFQANDAISKASGLPKPLDDLQQFRGLWVVRFCATASGFSRIMSSNWKTIRFP